jgi:tRNA A37 threonylcarbamoyladenosine biosynthesis protein TsaE
MYRLNSFKEMVEKGIIDQMNTVEYILIERPKRTEQLELGNYAELQIEKTGENERKVRIITKN